MEKEQKLQRTFEKFEKALRKFEEVIKFPHLFDFLNEELIIEISTKRFEYTFESLWKTLKEFLRIEGIICSTPLQCFKEAFKRGLIKEEYESIFSQMVEKRNRIVHIYGAEEAKEIYKFIKKEKVFLAFKDVYERLKNA
jgi:nucleotidyltransferase substrate binding protein (TIGR01987 family)